jgi:VWFA-related protein
MLNNFLKTTARILLTVASLLIYQQQALGQSKCLTDTEVKSMVARLQSQQNVAVNTSLKDELLKLKADHQKLFQSAVEAGYEGTSQLNKLQETRSNNTARLCQIIKESGWPTSDLVRKEGAAAAFFLLKNSESFELQRELFPVIVEAVKKGEIEKADFAGFVDRLRVRAGLKQLFGTQATIVNGFLVLYPIIDEAHLDARRKQYELPPLDAYLRSLERAYQIPLIKAPTAPEASVPSSSASSVAKETSAGVSEEQTIDEGDVLRVDTNLVNINVSVYNSKLKAYVGALEEKDFAVAEDGHKEEIAYFASTNVPFDLVLLLDLSGSTSNKRDLIRKSTRRFIEAARPTDRVAIVTFYGTNEIVSPLTSDRAALLEKAKKIDGRGSSNVWDALKFTLDNVFGKEKSQGRRRAIVLMSDGVDNALWFRPMADSYISFADLVEAVRRDDTLIIPIYLDTEADGPFGFGQHAYENARKTLKLLASESGGLYYTARKVEDLNGVYDQVINDLGKVYSLGYKPTNEKRDGSWRSVKVWIPERPDLLTRTRPGYYAN